MIVWGGIGYGYENTGGRYNPTTDTWVPTSTINAPEGRANPTAVWTGSEMIIWGGYNARGDAVNTGGRYNPPRMLGLRPPPRAHRRAATITLQSGPGAK
jgi:hypothetical protein